MAENVSSATTQDAPRAWHSPCAGKVTWMTGPAREVSECVLPRWHRGDHRDAGGYPWNEGRWAD